MNILLWAFQIAVALLAAAGGAYKMFSFDALEGEPWFGVLPRFGWTALGVFEIVCAILLIVPMAARRLTVLTPLAGAGLAVESAALGLLYARYSLQPTPANPLVWVILIGLLAAVVAWGRYARAS